jgi:hypothetical protein
MGPHMKETAMPDDLSKRGGQDRKRIDVTQDYELQSWSEKFAVSRDQLKEAVQAVGDNADAVERYLAGGRSGDSSSQSKPGRGRTGSDSGGSDRGSSDKGDDKRGERGSSGGQGKSGGEGRGQR